MSRGETEADSVDLMPDGTEVRFVGYSTPSPDVPQKVTVGEHGTIVSSRRPDQHGHDYFVQFASGTFGFDRSEVEKV